jgi:hypothetical protein
MNFIKKKMGINKKKDFTKIITEDCIIPTVEGYNKERMKNAKV